MALRKALPSPTGATGEYWLVGSVEFNYGGPAILLRVFQYFNQTERQAGKQVMHILEYTVTGSEAAALFSPAALDAANKNPRRQAYAYLKDGAGSALTQNPDFDFTAGTTDV